VTRCRKYRELRAIIIGSNVRIGRALHAADRPLSSLLSTEAIETREAARHLVNHASPACGSAAAAEAAAAVAAAVVQQCQQAMQPCISISKALSHPTPPPIHHFKRYKLNSTPSKESSSRIPSSFADKYAAPTRLTSSPREKRMSPSLANLSSSFQSSKNSIMNQQNNNNNTNQVKHQAPYDNNNPAPDGYFSSFEIDPSFSRKKTKLLGKTLDHWDKTRHCTACGTKHNTGLDFVLHCNGLKHLQMTKGKGFVGLTPNKANVAIPLSEIELAEANRTQELIAKQIFSKNLNPREARELYADQSALESLTEGRVLPLVHVPNAVQAQYVTEVIQRSWEKTYFNSQNSKASTSAANTQRKNERGALFNITNSPPPPP
jgi:hypothetical protein